MSGLFLEHYSLFFHCKCISERSGGRAVSHGSDLDVVLHWHGLRREDTAVPGHPDEVQFPATVASRDRDSHVLPRPQVHGVYGRHPSLLSLPGSETARQRPRDVRGVYPLQPAGSLRLHGAVQTGRLLCHEVRIVPCGALQSVSLGT